MAVPYRLLIPIYLAVFALSAYSAAESDSPQNRKNSCALSSSTAKKLRKAQKKIEKGIDEEAKNLLHSLLESSSSCDRAFSQRAFGYLMIGQERFKEAIPHFERALKADVFGTELRDGLLLDLAQLYIQAGRYKDAVSTLSPQISADSPPLASFLLGYALAQLERYKRALPHLKQAVDGAKKPREAWYQNLLAVQYALKRRGDCLRTLGVLVEIFPKEHYFAQLASLLSEGREHLRAASVLEIAHALGFIGEEDQIRWLAALLLEGKAPQRAALLLSEELKNGGLSKSRENLLLTAEAWLQAQEVEEALKYFTEARAISEDDDISLRIARLHLNAGHWKRALRALERSKGDLNPKVRGEFYYLRGLSLLELNCHREAEGALKRAIAEADNTRAGKIQRAAEELLAYIRNSTQ